MGSCTVLPASSSPEGVFSRDEIERPKPESRCNTKVATKGHER